MNRRDWHIGRLHIIRRDYTDPPQYGCQGCEETDE